MNKSNLTGSVAGRVDRQSEHLPELCDPAPYDIV